MPNRFSEIASQSAELTKRQLNGEIAKLTSLSDEKLEKMLPSKADKEKFTELMEIVNSSTSRNKKVASIRDNIERLGTVLVKVLEVAV